MLQVGVRNTPSYAFDGRDVRMILSILGFFLCFFFLKKHTSSLKFGPQARMDKAMAHGARNGDDRTTPTNILC